MPKRRHIVRSVNRASPLLASSRDGAFLRRLYRRRRWREHLAMRIAGAAGLASSGSVAQPEMWPAEAAEASIILYSASRHRNWRRAHFLTVADESAIGWRGAYRHREDIDIRSLIDVWLR